MVKQCDQIYPQNILYDQYFEKYPYPLSDFQKWAIQGIVEGNHVLVTAHTGSGKTLPAEFAIEHFVKKGKKVIYTAPIKALSNQKFYEFTHKYPHISFGLFTGDIKMNPTADVIIMTTEILMNRLFTMGQTETTRSSDMSPLLEFDMNIAEDLACVIFDEVHYINDADRGQTWEQTIMMLPEHVQMVMLSATIDNPAGFAQWVETTKHGKKEVWLSSTNHRVVPLTHYSYMTTTEQVFKHVQDKTKQKEIRDATNEFFPLKTAEGVFKEEAVHRVKRLETTLTNNQTFMKRKHVLNQLTQMLKDRDMLPAIAFVFSRKHVELTAKEITTNLLEFDSKIPYTIARECEQIVRKFPNYREYLELPEYGDLIKLLERGIGIHHSGMIPVLREIVEIMISRKCIKLLFATESFAIGLDCPIKTAIFTGLTKYDGKGPRFLYPHEYTQMAGRAGRRGLDTIGHVIHCNNLYKTPSTLEYKELLCGKPQKLVSKFHIQYNTILSLLRNGPRSADEIAHFVESSMISQQLSIQIQSQNTLIAELKRKLDSKTTQLEMMRTPRDACNQMILLDKSREYAINKKRKAIDRDMANLKDAYRYIAQDMITVHEYNAVQAEYEKEQGHRDYLIGYIRAQINIIGKFLLTDGYMEEVDAQWQLTHKGKHTAMAEVHCLLMARILEYTHFFKEETAERLVAIFSCFTQIRVPDDLRMTLASIGKIDKLLDNMCIIAEQIETREFNSGLDTGIHYENLVIFDLYDEMAKWCKCTNEVECKEFIQRLATEKEISVGDFTKAVLKISTIAKELGCICESVGEIELLNKLSLIDGMILKYITTAQSLYI